MQFRYQATVWFDHAFKNGIHSLIIYPISILDIVSITEVYTRQWGMITHQTTQHSLHHTTIDVVILQFKADATVIRQDSICKVVKSLPQIVHTQINVRDHVRAGKNPRENLWSEKTKSLILQYDFILW